LIIPENIIMASDPSSDEAEKPLSALQENIESKGKHSYYFAHAHKANGPKWDGKAEPKLLSLDKLSVDEKSLKKSHSTFDYHKSNITSYAFADGEKSVKLFITMAGIGEKVRTMGVIFRVFFFLNWSLIFFSVCGGRYQFGFY
jgi:hypothetical protein